MQASLLAGFKRGFSTMASFAAAGGSNAMLARAVHSKSALCHRLLPQADAAMLRHGIQPSLFVSRVQHCAPLQAQGRRDMSAQAAALDDDVSDTLERQASLEEEFETARVRALGDNQGPTSLSSLFEDEDEVLELSASDDEDESLRLENCGLSKATVDGLNKRGIFALFPIQKGVFDPVMEGRDIIARARTGSGKTLAFALPVIESLVEEDRQQGNRRERGRAPRCIVLTPTRELAQQIKREFEESAPSLTVGCFYGGAPLPGQINILRNGCDIAVGTPGRVQDLMQRSGSLKLDKIRFAILDEADRMLSDGFEEDVEAILKYSPKERQTLLFSATMPGWVKRLTRQYQQSPLTVDLVGDASTGKLAESIRMLSVCVQHDARRSVLVDLLTVYGGGGKCIVFTQTKRDADEVSAAIANHMPTEALHGDITQSNRERTLKKFRDGKLLVLVATDVAARGLDIPAVDLVVHYELPTEVESFLHRSGRTGRAGRSGTAIAMFTPREDRYMRRVLKETNITNCEMIGPPAPTEVMSSASKAVVGRLDIVEPKIVQFFRPAAEKVMGSADPTAAMAAALAALAGVTTVPKPRSLLAQDEGSITIRIMTKKPARVTNPGSIFGILRNVLNRDASNYIGKIRMLLDQSEGNGAAFDLPEAVANEVLAQKEELATRHFVVDAPHSLPMDPSDDGGYMPSRGGRRGGGGGGGFRRGGGGGGYSRGGGGGYSRGGGGSSYSGGGGGRSSYGGGGRSNYGGGDSMNRGGGGGGGWKSASGGGGGGRSSGGGAWGDRSSGRRGYSKDSYGGSRSQRSDSAPPSRRSAPQAWDFGN